MVGLCLNPQVVGAAAQQGELVRLPLSYKLLWLGQLYNGLLHIRLLTLSKYAVCLTVWWLGAQHVKKVGHRERKSLE